MLNPDELARAAEFRFEPPRQRFEFARGALRTLLSRYLAIDAADIELMVDEHKKPHLAARHTVDRLQFNVAHSGDLALIAFTADCEVGVDIEELREIRQMEQLARRFFHPAETDAVLATPAALRNEAFLRCWTGKEAVLKAYGTGITGRLDEFQVPLDASAASWIERPQQSSAGQPSRCWLRPLAPCDGYIGAVACVGCERTVCCFTFSST